MDPRDRADALLARARARSGYVVTPEDAVSPMDAASTQQIPRAVVTAADSGEPDIECTSSIPAPKARDEAAAAPSPAGEAPPPPEAGGAEQPPATRERQVDGMVPTVQETPMTRRSLSERLGGQ